MQFPEHNRLYSSPSVPLLHQTKKYPSFDSFMEMLDRGNSEEAIEFLKRTRDLNAQDENGTAPIHLACHYCNTACIEYLISQNVNLNLPGPKGIVPLIFCLTKFTVLNKVAACYKLMTENGAIPQLDQVEIILDRLSSVFFTWQEDQDDFMYILKDLILNNPTINFNRSTPTELSLINILFLSHLQYPEDIYSCIQACHRQVNIHEKDRAGYSALDVARLLNNPDLLALMDPDSENSVEEDKPALFKLLGKFTENPSIFIQFTMLYQYALYFEYYTPLQTYYQDVLADNDYETLLPCGDTLFFPAIYLRDLLAIELLANQKVNINKANFYNETPLITALNLLENSHEDESIRSEVIEMALLLLQNGSDPLAFDLRKPTLSPLHLCIKYNLESVFKNMLEQIIKSGINIYSKTDYFFFLLYSCIQFKRSKQYSNILEMYSKVTKSQHLNLGDIKVTKSQHLNLGDIPPLDENGSIISDLVASGVDINAYYSTLDDKQHKLYVNRAIANNASIFFLNFLESKGMNIHAHPSSKYCLQDAIQNGNLETLKWLIERGIGPSLIILDKQQLPNSFGLHLAVTLKQYEIVNCLLMHRCQELNQKNAKGKTAMDIAIALKDEKLINMLKNAIDIDHRIRAFNTIVLEPLEKFLKNKGNSIKSMKCCYVENCPKIVIEITLQTTEKLTAALKELDMDYALNPYQDPLTPKKLKRKINTVYFDLFPHSTDYSDVLKVLKKHFQPAKRQSYKPQDPSFYTPPVPTASTSTKDTQTPKKDTPKSTSDTQSSKDSKSFTSFKLPPQQPDAYYLQIIAEKQKQERDFLESENPQNRQSGVGKSKSRRASDLKNDQCSFPNPLILNRAKPDFIEEKEEETMISSNEKKPSKKLLPSSIKKAPLPKRAPVNDSTPSSQITPRRRKKRHAPPPLTIRSMLSAPVERKLTTLTAAKTNFETYFQSALNSHIGIGDLITRIDSKENYDIERSLFDRKLVKYALEYRLLRFTQALLATGNQMTAIDRGIFDTNVCQAFNLDQLTSIRNQVRHAECLNLNELIKLCEELSLESVKHSLEVLTLGKQEALDTLIPLQLKQTLTTLEWDIHFSGEKDEKEKEYEGDQSDNAKKYLREQFHFLESAFKPFKEDFYRFTKEGDRKDAMKMCILKMAACVSYLQPSRSTKAISQEITLKGNILAHEVQDIIPYCDMDEISDGKLYKFIKRLDLNKESFALST